jgi:hypothetical protein
MAGPRPHVVAAERQKAARRWRPALAGLLVAAVLVAALGIGAYAVLGRAPAHGAARDQTAPPATPAAVPSSVIDAARPVQLTATDGAADVVLHWQLGPSGAQYPIVVQQVEAGRAPGPVTVVQKGTRTTTLSRLNPGSGYCFTVGALVATGRPATIAWSQPACIRGAFPEPTPPGG